MDSLHHLMRANAAENRAAAQARADREHVETLLRERDFYRRLILDLANGRKTRSEVVTAFVSHEDEAVRKIKEAVYG